MMTIVPLAPSVIEHLLHLEHSVDQARLAQCQRVIAQKVTGRGINLFWQKEKFIGYAEHLLERPQSVINPAKPEQRLDQPVRARQKRAFPTGEMIVSRSIP